MDSSKTALLAVATVLVMLRLAHAGGVREYPIANPPQPPAASSTNAVRCAPVQIGAATDPSSISTSEQQREQQR